MKKARLAALLILLALLLPLASCGTAGDIRLVSVTSKYLARPEITDADTVICLNFDNQTENRYRFVEVVLERLGGLEPERIEHSRTEMGVVWPMAKWEERIGNIFLFSPLEPGQYRLRCVLASKGQELRKEIGFNVEKRATHWDVNKLVLSTAEITESEHIRMIVANPDTILADGRLDIRLDSDRKYTYGEASYFEVFLDGQWYMVPLSGEILMPLYHTGDDEYARNSFTLFLTGSDFGPLLAGRYRLVKAFGGNSADPYTWTPGPFAPEVICVEFTLEQDMIPN